MMLIQPVSSPESAPPGPSRACNFPIGILLLCLLLGGCASRPFVGSRAFDFQKDTFAYANELVWDYYHDETGKWVYRKHEPEPDYTHHCFVVARSVRQFFQHATFDPTQPIADETTYRRLIRRVISVDPRHVLPEEERVLIPGYGNLRAFSNAHESLIKAECGGSWQSYFQRGHWRIVFPFSRANQESTAAGLLKDLKRHEPPVVHLVKFPELSINHAVLVFAANETAESIEFLAYDPNKPDQPKTLNFDRSTRTFRFAANDYWPGGELNAYKIYWSWRY